MKSQFKGCILREIEASFSFSNRSFFFQSLWVWIMQGISFDWEMQFACFLALFIWRWKQTNKQIFLCFYWGWGDFRPSGPVVVQGGLMMMILLNVVSLYSSSTASLREERSSSKPVEAIHGRSPGIWQ